MINMRFCFSFINFLKGQLRVPSCTSLQISPRELFIKLAHLFAAFGCFFVTFKHEGTRNKRTHSFFLDVAER
jgi:hypothetical protein